MKKVLVLLASLLSFAMIGCSDSEDSSLNNLNPNEQEKTTESIGYETFSKARSVWKEPRCYSYTISFKVADNSSDYETLSFLVENGRTAYKVDDGDCYNTSEKCNILEKHGWNVDTIKGLFDTIDKLSFDSVKNTHTIYTVTEPENMAKESLQKNHEKYFFVKYDNCNNMTFPAYVEFVEKTIVPRSIYVNNNITVLRISDFKILSE